jgi:hypothetical protein
MPRAVHAVSLAAALAALCACGASINAVYEGDVRFEHCMALDEQKDVKPTIRKACWEEWSKFYTFGQTRDRVEHAKRRVKQLNGASELDEAAAVDKEPIAAAVPEPTSPIAPPPMFLATDAGTSDADGGLEDAPTDAPTDANKDANKDAK